MVTTRPAITARMARSWRQPKANGNTSQGADSRLNETVQPPGVLMLPRYWSPAPKPTPTTIATRSATCAGRHERTAVSTRGGRECSSTSPLVTTRQRRQSVAADLATGVSPRPFPTARRPEHRSVRDGRRDRRIRAIGPADSGWCAPPHLNTRKAWRSTTFDHCRTLAPGRQLQMAAPLS